MSKVNEKVLMPIIYVESVDQQRDFYVEKLGFNHMMGVVGKDGQFDFCTVVLDGIKIMLSRPQEKIEGAAASHPTKRPVEIYMPVADVDAYYAKLKKGGVKMPNPPTTQWWGDRTFHVIDPYGYIIYFYQTVREPQPPQGMKIV